MLRNIGCSDESCKQLYFGESVVYEDKFDRYCYLIEEVHTVKEDVQ